MARTRGKAERLRKGTQVRFYAPFCSPLVSSYCISSSFFFRYSRFVTSAPNSWFSPDKYFIFPPPSLDRHAVICVTPGNVHCHLGADCSASAPNRSVRTGRPLMRGTRQSRAHFQKARLAVLTQAPSRAFSHPSKKK